MDDVREEMEGLRTDLETPASWGIVEECVMNALRWMAENGSMIEVRKQTEPSGLSWWQVAWAANHGTYSGIGDSPHVALWSALEAALEAWPEPLHAD